MIVPLLLSLSITGVSPGLEDGLWGNLGFGFYPMNGEKVAPNGMVYEPMFRLIGELNVGSDDSYFFARSAYYTEKPNPGVTTNKTQGSFDFTKRQYDFDLGYSMRVLPHTDAQFWLYSLSNINRGRALDKPFGFKDGFIGALRYDLDEVSSVNGQASVGYYFTKDLVDTEGGAYSPGLFAEADVAKLLGHGVRGYGHVKLLTERNAGLKEIDTQLGVEYRFGKRQRNRGYLLLENDFGEGDLSERRRVLLEFRRTFQGS